MINRNYKPVDINEILKLYFDESRSTKEIAEKFGCSTAKILRDIKNAGFTPKTNKKPINLDEVRKLYLEENLSAYRIAKIFNVSRHKIERELKALGIKKNHREKPYNYIHVDKNTLYDLYIVKDMTTREIAEHLNISQVQVAAKLREVNIKKDPSISKRIRSAIKIGDKQPTNDGYWRVYHPEHPNATKTGWILEHRYIMSRHLGRPLTKNEVVHHVNEDRKDNRIENLQLEASAGLHTLNHHAKIYNDEELLKMIIDFYHKNGRFPRVKEMTPANNLGSYKTYSSRFGSTKNAIHLAANRLHDEHGA